MKLFVLLLFFHVASPDCRQLTLAFTVLFGVPDTPELMCTAELDGVPLMYYDSITRAAEPKQKWMEQMMKERPELTERYINECTATHRFFSDTAKSRMQRLNQTGGVHVFQRRSACGTQQWTDFNSHDAYAYDGETVMTFDMEKQTWIAIVPEAVDITKQWNCDETGLAHALGFHHDCPKWRAAYCDYETKDLSGIKFPSVSLLQKSPFSFITCHASGFYPRRAKLLWTRDGTIDDVESTYQSLPNNDGTYQLRVDVNIGSHDNWTEYACVFQFFDGDAVVVRLNKSLIKTNWGNFPSKHSLKFLVTQSFGVKNFPEFVGIIMADETEVGYCDSDNMTATPKTDWMKDLLEADAEFNEWFDSHCLTQRSHLSMFIDIIMKMSQHSEGIHTFQMMTSFETKGDSSDVISQFQYGYDGEDFIKFDIDTKTWVASNEHARKVKRWWDSDHGATTKIMTHFNRHCPDLLRKYSQYGKSSLQRTELPSVNLLQKSPLSPITCHATGFYPKKAKMFWRKDGEEIHNNDTEPSKSLPNDDDTFQMSINLNISLIQAKDWDKYDCVFQLLGVQYNVTKLDKAAIRTNWETTQNSTSLNIGVYISLYIFRAFGLLFLIAVTGYYMWRREKKRYRPAKRNQKIRKGRRGLDNLTMTELS